MIEEQAIQIDQLAKANVAASSSTPIAAAAAIHMGLAAQNHKTHSSAALFDQCSSCSHAAMQ